MTWDDPIRKAPSPGREPWTTNERIQEEWGKHVRKRGAKNTQRNLIVYTRPFFRAFEHLVTELEQPDVEAFVARMETKCAKLMVGKNPQCLAGCDVSACPLLAGRPAQACPKYQPLQPSGVWSYICAVNRLYEWLIELGRVPRNPCLPVMRDYASRHSAWFDERRRKPRRRHLTVEDVRALVLGSPIHHSIGYLLMAKCFLRLHEALKLSFDPQHCDLEQRWMDIPPDWELGDKRLGNPRIILDTELMPWMRRYQAWWEEHVKRDANGEPLHRTVLITQFGLPWGKGAAGNFNSMLQADAMRAGCMSGTGPDCAKRITTHGFRSWATTEAKRRGCSTGDVQVLRGDLSPGALIRYDDYLARLPDLYRSYGPRLGLA